MTAQLTPDEAERLRQILSQHDAQTTGKGAREFDLNNPPTKQYRHQEYPKAMHNHSKRATKNVNSREEQATLEAKGFQEKPFPPVEGYGPDEEAAQLSTADLVEIAALEKAYAEEAAKKARKESR